MKYVLHLIRYFVAIFFVFSGVVKAIDPTGTAIKMKEYFEVFQEYIPVLDPLWHLMSEYSLGFSIFMVIFEIVLGVGLWLGIFYEAMILLLLAMIVFFTFLTGFTTFTGKVTDCGCFGDFMKLKPIVTFMKDVVLSVLLLILWFTRKKMLPFVEKAELTRFLIPTAILTALLMLYNSYGYGTKTMIFLGMMLSAILYAFHNYPRIRMAPSLAVFGILSLAGTWFSFRNVWNLPIVDFRAYKEGVNLCEGKSMEGLDPGETLDFMIYKNESTGETKRMTTDEFTKSRLWEDKSWKFADRESTVIREPELPKIKDFLIADADGEDQADAILAEDGLQFFVAAYSIDKSNDDGWKAINGLMSEAKKKGSKIYGLTGSLIDEANVKSAGNYEFYNLDATPIKTMIRSNPGLVVFKDCKLLKKYHYNNIPSWEQLQNDIKGQ